MTDHSGKVELQVKTTWIIKFKIKEILRKIKEKIKWKIFYFLFKNKNSYLIAHAKREMEIVGLNKPDADYGGMLYDAIIEMMMVFSAQDHSGFSAHRTLQLFNELAHFHNLTPLTSNPSEWNNVLDGSSHGKPLYQNRRNPAMFSNDLKYYYSVDDKKRKKYKL